MDENAPLEYSSYNQYPPKPILGKTEGKISYISILLFIVAYYFIFDKNITLIFILIVVLFIHELGHLLTMKFFNYNEVSMLFVPLLGALVTGEKHTISQKQRSFVILAGPIPGIIIGIVLYYINSFYYPNDIIKKASDIFIYLNVFNLLPFIPFDGGVLMENLFFSTGKKIQNVFITISALIIGSLAIISQNYLLLLIPVISIIRILHNNKVTKIRQQLTAENIDYINAYDDLTNEEYWRIRDTIIKNDVKNFHEFTPGSYRISENESKIITALKGVLHINFVKDLTTFSKLLFLFSWLLFIVAPVIVLLISRIIN